MKFLHFGCLLCSCFFPTSRSGFDSESKAKSKSRAVFYYFFLLGDITIGAKTVVHPKAKIIAESGPIIIGGCQIVHCSFPPYRVAIFKPTRRAERSFPAFPKPVSETGTEVAPLLVMDRRRIYILILIEVFQLHFPFQIK
jgi:hypothetical protein